MALRTIAPNAVTKYESKDETSVFVTGTPNNLSVWSEPLFEKNVNTRSDAASSRNLDPSLDDLACLSMVHTGPGPDDANTDWSRVTQR